MHQQMPKNRRYPARAAANKMELWVLRYGPVCWHMHAGRAKHSFKRNQAVFKGLGYRILYQTTRWSNWIEVQGKGRHRYCVPSVAHMYGLQLTDLAIDSRPGIF